MKKIKSILIMSILVLSVLIVISPVSADTYNVYPGDDIEDVIENAERGDTIFIHAGTYYPGHTIDIDTRDITIIGDSPSNTIIDFEHNSGDGICSPYRGGTTIKNITVKNAGSVGIHVDDGCTIENCIVYGCGEDGFQVYEDSTFKNCLSYDNGGNGFDDEEDCTYINCTAANNGENGFYNDDCGDTLVNCIAVGNEYDGFDICGSIIYSNAWGNGENPYERTNPGIGSISVDPKFVDGIDTFYLSPGSPSVDKGSESSAALGLYEGFTTRTDGKWDTGTVDMGFHYASNNGPPHLGLPIAKILEILKGNQEE